MESKPIRHAAMELAAVNIANKTMPKFNRTKRWRRDARLVRAINRVVLEHTGLTMSEVRNASRQSDLAEARALICYFYYIYGLSPHYVKEEINRHRSLYYSQSYKIAGFIETEAYYAKLIEILHERIKESVYDEA